MTYPIIIHQTKLCKYYIHENNPEISKFINSRKLAVGYYPPSHFIAKNGKLKTVYFVLNNLDGLRFIDNIKKIQYRPIPTYLLDFLLNSPYFIILRGVVNHSGYVNLLYSI